MKKQTRKNPLSSFTLVELLFVIALMTALMLLIITSVSNTQNSLNLNSAAMLVSDYLRLARQTAVTTSNPVEVVLFDVSDASGVRWAGLQLAKKVAVNPYETDDSLAFGYQALTKPVILAQPVQFSVNTANSTIRSLPVNSSLTILSPLIINPRSFTFYPNGSSSMNPENIWSLTVVLMKDANATNPSNFVTILIDPVSGRSRSYQP